MFPARKNDESSIFGIGQEVGISGAIDRCHSQREVSLHGQHGSDTVKSLGSDANDRERMSVDRRFFSNDERVGMKSTLPIAITEDDERVGVRRASFGGQDQSAQSG